MSLTYFSNIGQVAKYRVKKIELQFIIRFSGVFLFFSKKKNRKCAHTSHCFCIPLNQTLKTKRGYSNFTSWSADIFSHLRNIFILVLRFIGKLLIHFFVCSLPDRGIFFFMKHHLPPLTSFLIIHELYAAVPHSLCPSSVAFSLGIYISRFPYKSRDLEAGVKQNNLSACLNCVFTEDLTFRNLF